MRRLALVVALMVLGVSPTAFSQLPPSFAFATFDAPFLGAVNTENGGINNSGTSVGDYSDASGSFGSFHGYKRSAHGSFTPIDFPGGVNTVPSGINTLGVIVGDFVTDHRHCFVLDANGYRQIDAQFPGVNVVNTGCRGINDLGQIVGVYVTQDPTTGRQRHGFLLTGGVFTSIDFPGASHTNARGINNAGQIVGRYVQSGVNHGFLLNGATPLTIDFPGAKETVVGGLNNEGQMVGTYRDANDFLFGFMVPISQSLSGSPPPQNFTQIVLPGQIQNVGGVGNFIDNVVFASFVAGVNDQGQISGEFLGVDNHVHGFVTAPQKNFEVTGSAAVGANPSIIAGVFEGNPVGEGSFTLDMTGSPAAAISWGQFIFCGRFQPKLVLTTTVGDQIFVDLLVTLCQTAFPPVPFLGVASGFYQITGGTGRFQSVSGGGFFRATAQIPAPPASGPFTFTLAGTISR